MLKRILPIILIGFFAGNSYAQQQQRLSTPAAVSSIAYPGTGKSYYAGDRKNEPARAIEFEEGAVTASYFVANINTYFNIPVEFIFSETESNTDNIGMRHRLLQQYYKGIPIEGLGYRVHERNGFVTSANGKAVRDINLNVNTVISEEQAFQFAVSYLQTKDTVFRDAEKLIVSKNFTYTPESFAVAYQFDMDVSLIERWRISIDARTGEVINKVSLVNTCSLGPHERTPLPLPYGTGTGMTNYYGNQTIQVEKFENSTSSRLIGKTENGGNIGTYDFRNVSILSLTLFFEFSKAYDFYSQDNTYNTDYLKPAVSVQWASEKVYEYYFKTFNRNSYDNNGAMIKSYVHVDRDLNNAFWTGKVMGFGDGSNNNPLVELDVVSHELTHAVTQYEAQLQYYSEPGALSESFSDIFGKVVEFSVFGDSATWKLAKYYREGGLRDMSNPNLKNQPDTYKGYLWHTGSEDNGGVHYNSGVQNFWFYLLCEGGSGTNDHGVDYNVESIGMDAAAAITYRNLTEYLSPLSDYLDSRIGSMLAAADLFGKNSTAYQEVDKAWDAVGVIDEPIITNFELFDITATTVKIRGSLLPRGDTVSYYFEYGTTTAYGNSTQIYDYSDVVEGIITGLQSETKYFVRLVATNENGSTYSTAKEFTTLSLAPLVKIKHTVDVTETTAILHGKVNPNSLPASFYFEYGLTPALGMVTPSYPLPDTTEFLTIAASITDLQPRQTYYYRLAASNGYTTSLSEQLSFFTTVKPLIHSFTPVVATVGTEVTIVGENFNPINDKNLIYFGATRGTVLFSSATELKVKVPKGASFGSISVLDIESGLITESTQEFVPTYTGEFKKGSFQLRAALDETGVSKIEVHDMDNDGRPDIFGSHNSGFSVYQNVNTGGDLTNESFIRSSFPIESFNFLALADLDGNGLKDVIGHYKEGLRVFPNFSIPGYIFFGLPIDLPIDRFYDMQFSDFDNDGRIDIVGYGPNDVLSDSCWLYIFRNESPKGALSSESFTQYYSQLIPFYIRFLTIADLDNDGKPDLMASKYGADNFSIIKNKSNPANFDFDLTFISDSLRGRFVKYIAQDLNEDGWKEITSLSPYEVGHMAIFESIQNLSYKKPVVGLSGHTEPSTQPSDIDGDGKVDLLVGDEDGRFIFLKNKTIAGGNFTDSSFVLFEHYGINENNQEVTSQVIVNDLNGDGRPEVINNLGYNFGPSKGHQLEIWQNSEKGCNDPSLIAISASRFSATIILPSNSTFDEYEIEYSPANATYWWQAYSTSLTGLQSGGSYRIRARAKCYLGFTNYFYIDFTTECVDLSSFSVGNIQINSASVNATNLSAFEVQYSISGTEQWVIHYGNQVTNLLPGTTYDLRFRGLCHTPTEFNYIQFTTLCPTLSTLSISNLVYNSAVVNATSNFVGEPHFEYGTDNLNWSLVDENGTMRALIPGQKYFVRGRLACTDTHSDYITTSFTTPCPKVSMLSLNTITPFSTHINWQDASATDSYLLTYSLADGSGATTIETHSTAYYLEGLRPGTQYKLSVAPVCLGAEDFTSTLFTTVCYAPYNLIADGITHTTTELSWEDHFGGYPYFIDYSIVGSNGWKTIDTPLTSLKLENLRPGTEYEVRVHIECPSETPPYASVRFKTNLYGETKFFPNPTDGIVTIHPSINLIGNNFDLYDNTGRRVATGQLHDYTIDMSGLPAGNYILKIVGEEPMKIVKY